jgi:putative nucleotidyltransferase with HDIG domain
LRKKTVNNKYKDYRIILVDDDQGVIDSLTTVLSDKGFDITGYTNPISAIEAVKMQHYDLLILDYLMKPLRGNEVVEEIRKFDKELYILLLTGHTTLVPPLETIEAYDIQGYCEKSDNFDQLFLMVLSAIKSIDMMRTISMFKKGLNKILDLTPRLYQLQPLDHILDNVLEVLLQFNNGENAFVLINNVIEKNTRGVSGNSLFKGTGIFKVGIKEFMDILSPEIMEVIGYCRANKKKVLIKSGVIFPLMNEFNETLGVLFVENVTKDYSIELLEIYTSQVSSSINNALLHSQLNIRNDELKGTYKELQTRYFDVIETLRLVVDAKDAYTRGHSDRVAHNAAVLGRAFTLSDHDVELLRVGGIFHDIGKIGTADDILFKSEKLTDEEFNEIKKHPIKGSYILSAVSMFKEVEPIVRSHHERIDGKGYPDGLEGDEISFLARIISVADAFDAMMSNRKYRSKLDIENAKGQLIKYSGTQFDSTVVEKFLQLLEKGEILLDIAE